MTNLISSFVPKEELKDFKEIVALLLREDKQFFLQNEILLSFYKYCDQCSRGEDFRKNSAIFGFLKKIQELIVREEYITLMHRFAKAKTKFYRLKKDAEYIEEISVSEYLDQRDYYILKKDAGLAKLRLDFMPFYDFSPSVRDTKTIGNGILFLNRYLSSKIFQNPEKWNNKLFEFIKLHKYNGQQLLVNGSIISDYATFYNELEKMLDWLKTQDRSASLAMVQETMQRAGFEVGWGNTVGRMLDTMDLLMELFHMPNDALLEQFIIRVPLPLISKIAVVSPHGWFGQENVLGLPDTGGQVIYILDQIRALEKHLQKEIQLTGLNVNPKIIVLTRLIPDAGHTTCNIRKEKIYETDDCWILRIPFRDQEYNQVPQWISRFHIWPYLERFAEDSVPELVSEFEGQPDLIIGNYSDGNLVATLLSDKLDVIQCAIAHALEKTKYLFSDLYWQDMEQDYHFSLQFTADILAMNKSDFVITSTHQEIVGTEDSIGQYESYQFFTMPGLYQVVSGNNLLAPKFNVIPPGVDEEVYFPYSRKEKRVENLSKQIEHKFFHEESDDIFGRLAHPDKIPIFALSRLDKIKNLTGLVEAFGLSPRLQEQCNLLFSAGTTRLEQSKDAEEQEEIKKIYRLAEEYNLHDKIRWLPNLIKSETGEAYRIMADRQGIFVQPAHFEAFGLTILEAMVCGLPTFGPKFGGPSEIIDFGVNGFLLNTSKPELMAVSLEEFFDRCSKDKDYWQSISKNGVHRVREHFNWRLYSERIIKLSKLYGFWRFSVSSQGKEKLDRYCDFIFHFLFRERAKLLENKNS